VNLTQSGTFAQVNVGTGIAITSTSTIDNANYSLTQPTGLTGDITPKTAIINIVANNKAYDGTTAATVLPSSPSFISPDFVTINFTSATFDTKDVGNNKTVTVTGINLQGLDALNYILTNSTATAIASIIGNPQPILILPNAFTPNGDGNNDIFKIASYNTLGEASFLYFEIYNRNGKLMEKQFTNIDDGWNGRSGGVMQDMGIYFVKLVKLKDGKQVAETTPFYLLK
jgi:gliding motility-associated-like protein